MGAVAVKEWAVVVRALIAGEQILEVRKGGLREEGRHFGLHATRFWLYPTSEHQKPELLKPAYRRWIDPTNGARPDQPIHIEGWADVVGVARIADAEELRRLDSRLIWTPEYVASRLRWKDRDPLWVLALRVHRILEPITVRWRDDYAGCTSWVELDGLPEDPESVPGVPAVSDESFVARCKLAENELPGRFESPAGLVA